MEQNADTNEERKFPVMTLTSIKNRFAKWDGWGQPDPDGDVPKNAVVSNALLPEDEFQQFYLSSRGGLMVLAPPYNIRLLDRLAQENNALSPCIEAMVTNIEETGYDFEAKADDANAEDDSKIEALRDFFSQPWPGESFTSIRKRLRRDLERTGNAYLEVIRNPQDEITFLRHVDSKMVRLVTLDQAVPVVKKVRRNGKDVSVTMMIRERRFCQLLHGQTLIYFREFNSSRDVNKLTGEWAKKGERLPANVRGSEMIHFMVLPDTYTPYGLPRWINQLPSVIGSRKAEEYNLEFFDNGGVPPVLILLQGGTLQPEMRDGLESKLGRGTATHRNRVQVMEVMPSGGTFNAPNNVKVTVERFGAERQDDAMFEKYDDKCETRIRRSFRLPPIFVGQAQDYSFATAVASYAVAEAQVFAPERSSFDEHISIKLIEDMGYADYKLVSKPLAIQDSVVKLQGITAAQATGAVDPEDVIYEINDAVGTNLKYQAPPDPQPATETSGDIFSPGNTPNGEDLALGGNPKGAPSKMGFTAGGAAGAKGGGSSIGAVNAAADPSGAAKADVAAGAALRMIASLRKRDIEGLDSYIQLTRGFNDTARRAFLDSLVTAHFPETGVAVDGLADLADATMAVIAKNGGARGCDHGAH
jgi:PBSX family phage portal protein